MNETLDQIKSLLKSGSQRAGRDVSTKRPLADAPWARPYRGVASHRSKVAGLWALVFAAVLAPLAALGDLAYEGPPNDYIGFCSVMDITVVGERPISYPALGGHSPSSWREESFWPLSSFCCLL